MGHAKFYRWTLRRATKQFHKLIMLREVWLENAQGSSMLSIHSNQKLIVNCPAKTTRRTQLGDIRREYTANPCTGLKFMVDCMQIGLLSVYARWAIPIKYFSSGTILILEYMTLFIVIFDEEGSFLRGFRCAHWTPRYAAFLIYMLKLHASVEK